MLLSTTARKASGGVWTRAAPFSRAWSTEGTSCTQVQVTNAVRIKLLESNMQWESMAYNVGSHRAASPVHMQAEMAG